MSRYIIVPTTVHVYDELEKAQREIEVRFLENPGEKYLLAKLVATTENKLDFHFFEEEVKPKRKRVSKSFKQKAKLLQQLSDAGTRIEPNWGALPLKVTSTPNPISDNITINNPDVITTTTDGKSPVTYTTPQYRCKFDNRMAVVESVDIDGNPVYLCAEHAE